MIAKQMMVNDLTNVYLIHSTKYLEHAKRYKRVMAGCWTSDRRGT